MKFKLISCRNSTEFESLVNKFISNNEIKRIVYNTVSDDGFIIYIAYIEYL